MRKKILLYVFVIAILIFFDQSSKALIVSNLDLREKLEIIPAFFTLTYVRNTGMGFSLLEGALNLFFLITPIAILVLSYLLYKDRNAKWYVQSSYLLMIGGAFGNFIDRLRLGYVVDFLSFNFFGYHFPIFNLADSFLTVGVFLFLIVYLFDLGHGKKNI